MLESDGEVVVCVLADRGNILALVSATVDIFNITTQGIILMCQTLLFFCVHFSHELLLSLRQLLTIW